MCGDGGLHVLGHDPAARSGAGDGREVDAEFPGDAAGVRGYEQPAGPGGSGRRITGRGLARGEQPADECARGQRGSGRYERVEQSLGLGLDVGVHLVGGKPHDHIAGSHRATGRCDPFGDRAFLHRQPELGQQHLDGHCYLRSSSRRQPSAMRVRSGM